MKNITKYIFGVIFIFTIFCALSSCKNTREESGDLSFAGITIGKSFPDSLKANFEYSSDGVPFYEGRICFKLPSEVKDNLSVVAATDLNEGKVHTIQIGNLNNDEAGEFYDMLKTKYGLPKSQFGDTDCRLQNFLYKVYKQLGYEPYEKYPDITGDYILAEWHPMPYKSTIYMIANIFHRPGDYKEEIWTYVFFKYVDEAEYRKVEKDSENRRLNRNRENYWKQNSESMNQDF